MARPSSPLNTSDLYLEQECFYSQIKDCHLVPAWKETATVLVWVNWGTVLLGILVTFLSVHVRRKRSLLRNIPPPDYHQLSQFEVFLALMAISCLFNAIALSLSIYVSIRTVLLHSLNGLGVYILYIAALLFVNMVLKSNSLQNRTIRIIRTIFLPALILPITSVTALFIYQGYYSDYFQYTEHTKTVHGRFMVIVSTCAGLWLLCFIALDIVLIVARNSFASHLRSVMGPSIGRLSSTGRKNSSSMLSATRKSPTPILSTHQNTTSVASIAATQQAEIVLALKNAVTTLGWLVVGASTLIGYSMFYGVIMFLINNSVFLYYATLVVSYCTGFILAFIIYVVNMVNIARQLMNVKELAYTMKSQNEMGSW